MNACGVHVQLLSSLQDALDDLTQRLTALETELRRCKSVGDLLASDLQQNIDSTLASLLFTTFSSLVVQGRAVGPVCVSVCI